VVLSSPRGAIVDPEEERARFEAELWPCIHLPATGANRDEREQTPAHGFNALLVRDEERRFARAQRLLRREAERGEPVFVSHLTSTFVSMPSISATVPRPAALSALSRK